ncbi:MAG: antibiotic biosynthesis monooxygenase family protein [Mycobacterium sp.]
MITIVDVDPATPFIEQLQNPVTTPITIVNTFLVPKGKYDEVIAAWKSDSAIMKAAPGFISAQLYRGTHTSNLLTNVAVWESVDALRNAINSDEFQATLSLYPDGTVAYPHLLQKLAVAGICTA